MNLAENPYEEFDGFYAACSTYGSFSYLKYGPMRLFSQLAQDCPIKVGKVLWIAGHSGPETADDSRTHFGVFEPGVTQLFPDGHVCDLHPWEYNEVPVVLAAGLASRAPIVALHLTRPPVTIPDRAALGMRTPLRGGPRGLPDPRLHPGQDADGMHPRPGHDDDRQRDSHPARAGPRRPEREARCGDQPAALRLAGCGLSRTNPGPSPTGSTRRSSANRSRRLMHDWILHRICDEYAMTSDFDDRWRTGGTLEEVIEEAHLSPDGSCGGSSGSSGPREAARADAEDGRPGGGVASRHFSPAFCCNGAPGRICGVALVPPSRHTQRLCLRRPRI